MKKGKVVKQGTLDMLVSKMAGPLVFNCEDLLHAVTQFITVDDQVRLTVDMSLNHLILASHSPLQEKQHFKLLGCHETKVNITRLANNT